MSEVTEMMWKNITEASCRNEMLNSVNTERRPQVQRRFKGTVQSQNIGLMHKETNHIVRVAAYCRVSTNLDAQIGSLDIQISAFQQKIAEHPGWKLVDIYADEGTSGTSVKRRKEFQRMVADVKAGKIDYIITKSISRFARNTVECLTYVREFQTYGVQILFEKENVDTKSELSEMLLTVLAAFAQEESKSISDHVKWGIRKRFEEGIGRWTDLYGYIRDDNGDYKIMESEAVVVRKVYEMYIHGWSVPQISKQLETDGICTRNGKKWDYTTLFEMMGNERYTGDLVLQKYVRQSHLTHKVVVNDETEVPSFYVTNHHVPIISHDVFRWAQRTRELIRQEPGETCQYPYADTDMRCPYCGKQLVRRRTALHSGIFAWGCFSEGGCGNYGLNDKFLDYYVIDCFMQRWGWIPKESKRWKVNYWWLNDRVDRIILSEKTITVVWRDGSTTEAVFDFRNHGRDTPRHVAERYKVYLSYHADGEYKPGRVQRDKNVEVRPLSTSRKKRLSKCKK